MTQVGGMANLAIYLRPCLACRMDAADQEALTREAARSLSHGGPVIWREPAWSVRQRRRGLPVRTAMTGRLGPGSVVIVAEVMVLGRSLPDLVAALAEIEAKGATVMVAAEATARPMEARDLDAARRAYASAAAAEGRARARERGVRFGRPPVPPGRIEKVRNALAQGLGLRASARAAGVGVATAARIKAAAASAPDQA